jgi:hypothetical protein
MPSAMLRRLCPLIELGACLSHDVAAEFVQVSGGFARSVICEQTSLDRGLGRRAQDSADQWCEYDRTDSDRQSSANIAFKHVLEQCHLTSWCWIFPKQ